MSFTIIHETWGPSAPSFNHERTTTMTPSHDANELHAADTDTAELTERKAPRTDRKKPILCIDFDGVIHDYKEGWKDGSIYGDVTPGFFAWALQAKERFNLTIYSSRSKTPEGIQAMKNWMGRQLAQRLMPSEITNIVDLFTFASEKPPAFLTIDDRAYCFDGNWNDRRLWPEDLINFKPWNVA